MHSVAVGNKTLSLPTLVPSISSFETSLEPLAALRLQQTMREPVSLVSAYDVRAANAEFVDVCREFRKTSVLLLDSGGYEHDHIKRYAGDRAPTWTFDDFKAVCSLGLHDFAFSFDYFCRDESESESSSDFELRLIGEIFNAHDFVVPTQLIPVVHLQSRNGEMRLNESQILSLVSRVASECKSPFVAIPERELGYGIVERAVLAKKICEAIKIANARVGLHVLGCGNPLSFAFMCVAGAVMADGLEWCRTFAAENYHLHHFHQEPLFEGAVDWVYSPIADFLVPELPFGLKVATKNLVSFQSFMAGITPLIPNKTVHELVARNFGKDAGEALQAVET